MSTFDIYIESPAGSFDINFVRNAWVLVNGDWKKVTDELVLVGGEWKRAEVTSVLVEGEWKDV